MNLRFTGRVRHITNLLEHRGSTPTSHGGVRVDFFEELDFYQVVTFKRELIVVKNEHGNESGDILSERTE